MGRERERKSKKRVDGRIGKPRTDFLIGATNQLLRINRHNEVEYNHQITHTHTHTLTHTRVWRQSEFTSSFFFFFLLLLGGWGGAADKYVEIGKGFCRLYVSIDVV